jgi:hypothetical protein
MPAPPPPFTQPDTVLTAATAEETGPTCHYEKTAKFKTAFSRGFGFCGRFAKRHPPIKFPNLHALQVTTVFVQGVTELRRPDRPWGLPSLLYNGYRVISGGKAAGAWRWPPTLIQRQG